MNFLYDFFPLAVFFIVYKFTDIYYATGVLIIGSALQIGYMWFRFKRVEAMHVIAFLLVLIFGGATIILHDAMFLKWKVSIVNWLFGAAFLISQFFGKKTLIEYFMRQQLVMPHGIWQRLNLMWAIFFLLMGTLNIIVAYQFSTSLWVDFKVFGMMGLTLIFIILQTLYIYRHMKDTQP